MTTTAKERPILTIDGEVTRDPIFLFQFREWLWLGSNPNGWKPAEDFDCWVPDPEWLEAWSDIDDPLIVDGSDPRSIGEDIGVSWGAMAVGCDGADYFRAIWNTESVWLTREEAEAYGRARAYNYPNGWRVFCVCAHGSLTGALNAVRATR